MNKKILSKVEGKPFMRDRYFHLSIFLILFYVYPLFAVEKLGQTGFKWLSIPVSARAVGMGNAFSSIDGDLAGVYWNPATLSKVSSYEVMFSNVNWIADIKHMSFIGAVNWEEVGTFAIHFLHINYGNLDATIRSTNSKAFIDMGTFTPGGYSIGLGFARQITDKFSFGAVLKYCYEDLGTGIIAQELDGDRSSYKAQLGIPAFDLGTVFYPGFYDFRFSMTLTNFSQEEKYIDESFPLPLTFRLGTAMDIMKIIEPGSQHEVMVAVDMLHPRDYSERIYFGMEYGFNQSYFLRIGNKMNHDVENFSAGVGLKYDLGQIGLRIDYAYNNFKYFDAINFFTIALSY